MSKSTNIGKLERNRRSNGEFLPLLLDTLLWTLDCDDNVMLNKIKEVTLITVLEYLTKINIRTKKITKAQYRISAFNIAAFYMFFPSAPCTLTNIMEKLQQSQLEDKHYIIEVINEKVISVWQKTAKNYLETLSNSLEIEQDTSSLSHTDEPKKKKKRCFDFDTSARPSSSNIEIKKILSLEDEFYAYENMPVEQFEHCKIIRW